MKKTLNLILFIALIFVMSTCKKDSNDESKAPVLTTANVTSVTQTSATSGGAITSDGGSTVTASGICWSTGSSPVITDNKTSDGTLTGSFASNMTGLQPGKTYYVRAYATNGTGTGYGNAIPFTTTQNQTSTVTDIDGNVYNTIKIGNQWWMAQNLKVKKYRNNNALLTKTDNTEWMQLTEGAYCNYNNDVNNANIYGHIYNWKAATDSRNLCPNGWHMPSDDEWKELEMALGMSQFEADKLGWCGTNEGGKMKEAGTTHWQSPNTGANNSSGFSALPGGSRGGNSSDGSFTLLGSSGGWWSSTPVSTDRAYVRILNYNIQTVNRNSDYLKSFGLSVRCVKD